MKASYLVLFLSAVAFAADPAPRQKPDPTTVLTLLLSDMKGNPVSNASVQITQYTLEGRDHPPAPTINERVTSDAAGRVMIVTTPFRKVVVEFRVPGFRPARAELDRAYKRIMAEGQFDFTWLFREPKEGGDTGEIRSQFPRDEPLTISLLLPAMRDDDKEFESKLRALIPPEKPLPKL